MCQTSLSVQTKIFQGIIDGRITQITLTIDARYASAPGANNDPIRTVLDDNTGTTITEPLGPIGSVIEIVDANNASNILHATLRDYRAVFQQEVSGEDAKKQGADVPDAHLYGPYYSISERRKMDGNPRLWLVDLVNPIIT